jgi:hypothetical protein|nr:MAG TPA: hypothetical protein [Caudoviricetes sp.]
MVFELVKVGEIFSWEGELYMRTKLCKSNNILCNTVNIEDGSFASFENSELVEKLDVELTIH